MALHGSSDANSNTPIWVAALVNKAPNTANRDAMYGNTTANAFVNNQTVGVYGVSATERNAGQPVLSITVSNTGTGYTARPTLAIGGGVGDVNAVANVVGTVISMTLVGPGTGGSYIPGETLQIATGTAATNATANVTATEVRTVAVAAGGTGYANGDTVSMATGTGTQAVFTVTTGAADTIVASLALTSRGVYTVNPTLATAATVAVTGTGTGLTVTLTMRIQAIALLGGGNYTTLPTLTASATAGSATGTGATITSVIGAAFAAMTAGGLYTSVPSLTWGGTGGSGTAGVAVLGAPGIGAAHTGWVLRKTGTGGRAGRVQTEVLVAGGIASDGSDDLILPE